MTKVFKEAFITKLDTLKAELAALQTDAKSGRVQSSECSQEMVDAAIAAIDLITKNNDAKALKEHEKQLQDISFLIDGHTGLLVPAVFDELSLAFAQKSLALLNSILSEEILESGWASSLASSFSFNRTQQHYVSYLETQIKFFEFIKAKQESDDSFRQANDMSNRVPDVSIVDDSKKLETFKNDYQKFVNTELQAAEKFRITYPYAHAYEDAKQPITAADLFGREDTSDAFSEGRGQQKIIESLLGLELDINKNLAGQGLIADDSQLITSARDKLASSIDSMAIVEMQKRTTALIDTLVAEIETYKTGAHLSEGKSGLGKAVGFFQKALQGPDKRKTDILVRLNQELSNMSQDKNEMHFSYVLKLLNRVISAIKDHDGLVGSANRMSLGKASVILDDLRSKLCDLLMDINISNEVYLRDNMLKYHNQDLENIGVPKASATPRM